MVGPPIKKSMYEVSRKANLKILVYKVIFPSRSGGVKTLPLKSQGTIIEAITTGREGLSTTNKKMEEDMA